MVSKMFVFLFPFAVFGTEQVLLEETFEQPLGKA